jgi:hypothetical protein
MVQIVEIGKRRFLTGMDWVSYEDIPTKDELFDDATRLAASWAAVRVGESAIQAGFSDPIPGVNKPSKLFSLAALVADSHEQPWLGTFKISEGLWWYIAVRDGHAILPDGDVIGNEQEIYAARERHSGYTDWKYIEGDLTILSKFIAEIDAKPVPVRDLNADPKNMILAASVGAAILGLAAAGGYWKWHSEQVAKQDQLLAMNKLRQSLFKEKPPVQLPSPTLSLPYANDVLAACKAASYKVPLSQYGWEFSGLSCDPSGAMVHWARKPGATVVHKPEGFLSADGNAVDQMIAFSGLAVPAVDDATDLASEKVALQALAQAFGFELNFPQGAPAAVLPGAATSDQTAAAAPKSDFSMTVTTTPFNVDFAAVPGLRLSKIKWEKNNWTLTGELYGR